MKRLDQALVNDSWISSFPQCLLSHLPQVKSDHRPILFTSNHSCPSKRGRPSRFLTGWTKHVSFPSFVKDKWNFSSDMFHALSEFTTHVKE